MAETSGLFFTLVFLGFLWTLPWKGVALGRAARSGHRRWFVVLLVVNTLALLEMLYLFRFSARRGT